MTTTSGPPAYVVDAGIVSAIIFRNIAKPDKPFFTSIAPVIDGATLICSAAVYAEILYGAYKAKATRQQIAAINKSMQRFRIVWPNPQLADVYAQMRASLPKGHGMGHKPAESDRWTAATALMLSVPLLTTDQGYTGISGLDARYYPPVPKKSAVGTPANRAGVASMHARSASQSRC